MNKKELVTKMWKEIKNESKSDIDVVIEIVDLFVESTLRTSEKMEEMLRG